MVMWRRVGAATFAAVVLTGAVLVAVATPAGASCAPPLPIAEAVTQADVVVVGTVVQTRSNDRVATVAVDEVWRGNVGSTLEVFGGPDREDMATSVDRTYRVGGRYLIVAMEPSAHGGPGTFGGRIEDTACSATQLWQDALAALRPSDARVAATTTTVSPTPSTGATSATGGSSTGWWIAVVLASGFAAGMVAIVLRQRRRARPGARV